MRKSKRVISLVLTAIMVMTTLVVAVPVLLVDTKAATIDGVSQTRIVSDYKTIYAKYAAEFLGGSSEPTDIVIPGLSNSEDYVIQGMAHYPQKDWMLITAYHGDSDETGTVKPSKVFAIDNKTGEFVASFTFKNLDGTINTDHGGGIAISEHNIYYACGDQDRKIAYAPLSAIENAPLGQNTEIQILGERDFYEVGSVDKSGKTAYTAYVCYDEGVLWTGNFYDEGSLAGLVAAQYNAPANAAYNSMVWGYKLSGSSSAEEWANLTGATGEDCQGNPSYVVGLSNNIKDVQYAVVDNGKLYASSSFGTGKGTVSASGVGGMDDYSHLTIADIDLSVPGDKTVTFKIDASGTTRTVNTAYNVSWYQTFDFMPMSEGLCVIEDNIYMTFESASYKYREKAGTLVGNCQMPVDVVWKMDQYALLNEARPVECQSMYYEKVEELSQIKDGEEYMILFKSEHKDPLTQKPILYSLAANSGLNGLGLAKRYATESDGYIGAVGHPITQYDIEDGRLYLNNAEKDDFVENRWVITGANTEKDLRIKNSATYYANYRNLYINKDVIAMTDNGNSDLANMHITEAGNGNFYLHNNGAYLWCNDFSVAGYENAANNWYSTQSSISQSAAFMYGGTTETKGTFHPDGLANTNVIGQSVGENTYLGELEIYKRVVDYYSSTVENRVYTDLQADLQDDGTYKIVMETYATDPTQYQIVEERPTDFIFVLDASGSMSKDDCYTYTSAGQKSLTYNNVGDNDWYIYYEGEYCSLARHAYKNDDASLLDWDGTNYHCVDFRTSDNRVFHVTPNGIVDTTTQGDGPDCDYDNGVENICKTTGVGQSAGGGDTSHGTYEVFTRTSRTRISYMKESMVNVVNRIATSSADHRLAVVTFGSDGTDTASNDISNVWRNTGLYTNSSTTMVGYTSLTASNYANVFYTKDKKDTVNTIINSIDTSTGDPDTYVNYGFEMANQIIANSDTSYLTDGSRNVCIIMVTDGIPGKGGSDTTSATTVANAAIQKSKLAKQQGAYVYACQLGNNNMDGFNMNNYLEYVSSNYLVANSMTDYGSKNSDKINYHIDVDISQDTSKDLLTMKLAEGIVDNNTNATAILDADAVLREQLSDAFIIPDEATVSTDLVPGYFDAIGRLTFDNTTLAATDITTNLDKTNKNIVVTGYDYSNQYIADKHPGNKLRVTITGVLADGDSNLINTSINNVQNTAIFEDDTKTVPFKYFPREFFTIPEYTYVLDYGLQMYDSEVNGTLCAVSDGPTKQDVAAYTRPDPETQVSKNGLVEITNDKLDLLYRTTPTNFADSGYCLIKRDNGKYDWFSIKVVPASNVLFEEDYVTNKTGTTGVAWEDFGTPIKEYQDITTINDTYGYDSAYETNSNAHSNGTVSKVTVTSANKRSVTKTIDFIGKGFDLVSACGPKTGMMAVSVKDASGKLVKGYLVDTYYNGELTNGGELAYQVPVVNFDVSQVEGAEHGTYTVEITSLYLSNANALVKSVKGTSLANGKLAATTAAIDETQAKALLADLGLSDLANADLELVWFDNNSVLNGGTGAKGNIKTNRAGETTETLDCYIDGFRIYHPMENEHADYMDKEKDAEYFNVINSLNKNKIGTETTEVEGIAYVTGDLQADEETGVTPALSFANYQSIGPENELYLKDNSDAALVLKVQLPAPGSRVHLGLRSVTGASKVKVGASEFDINSATEMYYDVTDCVEVDDLGVATITIKNTGSSILAVNNIKLTGDATMTTVTEDDMPEVKASLEAESVRANVIDGVVTPVVDDTTTPDGGNDNVSGDDNSGSTGSGSFIEQLIAMIMEIIKSLFSFLPVGEVM